MDLKQRPSKCRADSKDEQYVNTFAAFADKYLQYILSGKKIPSVIVLVVIGVIFMQDNRAGTLQDWPSLLWTVQKCSFFVGLYGIYRFISWITRGQQK
jgi:hypothetical protein